MFLQFKYIFQVKSDCRRRIFMNENLIRIPEGTPRGGIRLWDRGLHPVWMTPA
jgi:hypothetical protein